MLRRSLFPLAITPLWSALAQNTQSGTPRDEAFWTLLRRNFPLRDGLIYLNAANVCPASLPVLERHQHFLRDFEADPSFQNRAKFGPLRERVRARAAQFFGVTANELALTRNTSEASNTIVHGLNLKDGDEVVLVEDNHPSNLDSWRNHSRRVGFTVKLVPATQLADSPSVLAERVLSALSPKTRVLSFTHLTSTTGLLYPAAEICRAAREKDVWTHLDGAQSAGMLAVDLRRIGCDSYATSSHKWLMGPLEAGVLYVASYRHKEVWPAIVSVGYSEDGKGGIRFLEAYGQRDDARLAALESTFDFLTMIGMPAIEDRVRQLTNHLMNQFSRNPKVQLRTNRAAALSCGVVKADLPAVADLRALDASLYSKHGMAFSVTADGPMRGMRVSPHIYNSLEQMDAVAEAFSRA
ncbi:MAG: aminotransferase class V-fold PLP-dependent enzyme [Acidobacteriota bacterium]